MPHQPISNVRALVSLHFSLLIGQLMFAIIAAYLIYSKKLAPIFGDHEQASLIGAGVIASSSVLLFAAFILYKRKVEKIRLSAAAVIDKLTAYRVSSLIFWAMLEVPTLLTITAFIITGIDILWIVVAALLLLFYFTKPASAKIARILEVSEEEVRQYLTGYSTY